MENDYKAKTYEETIKERQEKIKKKKILNAIDASVDEKAKKQEIMIKLETLIDERLYEIESSIFWSLKHILGEETDKYKNKKSSKSMANSSDQIKYLNERLKTVEEDINRIYENNKFADPQIPKDLKKYDDYLKMEIKIKEIERKMKIIRIKLDEFNDYYAEYLYDPYW